MGEPGQPGENIVNSVIAGVGCRNHWLGPRQDLRWLLSITNLGPSC